MRKMDKQYSEGHFTMLSMSEKEVDMSELEKTSSPEAKSLQKKSPRVEGRINYENLFIALRKGLL